MLKVRTLRLAGAFLGLLLLCSCATAPRPSVDSSAIVPASGRPATVTINPDAGRGNFLFVTLHLEDGVALPFVVDTGAPGIAFDKSLAPKLGKRLDTQGIVMPGDHQTADVFASPKLYLGNTLLLTGTNVVTLDFRRLSARCGHPIKGILGMDCLRYYCLQLDFTAGEMRFLDSARLETNGLGRVFPLVFSSEGEDDPEVTRPFILNSGLFGRTNINSLIDTGANGGGYIREFMLEARFGQRLKHFFDPTRAFLFPECSWEAESYPQVAVAVGGRVNAIGLGVLARHLVTFDFPGRAMYLRRTSLGPLPREEKVATVVDSGRTYHNRNAGSPAP